MELLQVNDDQIVGADGQPVRLRGTCVGGWMNMENFINGYPGSEHTLRMVFAEELGPNKAAFFFNRLLDYFLTEDDIDFMRQCGATVVRLSVNYRHFERDDRPFEYLDEGFKRLDQAIGWCKKHGLYAIIDLHAVQGWQNTDWHSDNASRHTLFWSTKHFQDRFVALWEEFARRYRGNNAVAGYNVMNEPATAAYSGRFDDVNNSPKWDVINAVYRRVVKAIRAIDPDHIIFLEGDMYSARFSGFEPPFAPNLVYSSHNYDAAGFGPGPYPGKIGGQYWDRAKQEALLIAHEGYLFARQHEVPLWVGEFGSVYNGSAEEIPDRLQALDDYLAIFNQHSAHWTTWTYKDVGVMGWVQLDPESAYMQLIQPLLRSKLELSTDFWMKWLPDNHAKQLVRTLASYAIETIADPAIDPLGVSKYMMQSVMSGFLGGLMQRPFAQLFKDMNETEIDHVLSAFAFKNCQRFDGLVEVVSRHM